MRRSNAIVLMAAVFFMLSAVSVFAQDSALRLAAKTGQVLIKVAGAAEFVEAGIGQSLNPKDVIRTGADGKVFLQFPGKSGFILKPDTEISVDELVWTGAARKVSVNMSVGKMKTLIEKIDSPCEFKVRTPSAVCGAKGAWWVDHVSAAGDTVIYVGDGTTNFGNLDGSKSYDVPGGGTSSVGMDGDVSEPITASAELVNEMTSGFDVGVIAEPYVEPENGMSDESYNFDAPEVTPEETSSPVTR